MRLRFAVLLLAALAAAAPALAAFPEDRPDDPRFAGDSPECVDTQQYELFDRIPTCTPLATDPEDSSGMFVERAWKEFTTGNPETVIAYVEAGINWRDENARELHNKVYLNERELPAPTTPGKGDEQCGTGVLCAADYADTPDVNENGLVDPEDIIVRFSDGRDDDANGYVDDISGWDFYNDQNNPATVDSAYAHANNQMERAGGETDNGVFGAGICPRCRVLPVKAGAEALDRTDELAQAWLFAVDSGASVVVSVTADLGYSTFMRQAAEDVARRGAIAVQASNDFDSTDHQGGMWWPKVLPGNGMVADKLGFGPGSATTRTFRERSNITSWGAHNVFTVATNSGTTSAATPTLGGVVALVMAYSREAAAAGKIARPLTGLEAVQVLRDTASDVDDDSLAWPNGPGWDLQFGYGRPNAHKAMQAISEGKVPPVATIDDPGWFTLFDPTRDGPVPVRGTVDATRTAGAASWKLELGVGAEPTDEQFREIASGSAAERLSGELGKADLSAVPESVWKQAMALSARKELETTERFTVTLRLRVTDAAGRVGEDRRAFFVHRDETAVPGFPKRIGPGGESQAALVDLQGSGRLDIVFGDTDGVVHAIDPQTGDERPGWPVRTDATVVARAHEGVAPGNEPVVSNVAVGDLDGSGVLSVVASTTTGRLYAWHADGSRRDGFPKVLDTKAVKPGSPRPALPRTRTPAQGAFAAPVLSDLNGDGRLDIVQAAWDGHIHAFTGAGGELPGWPVDVEQPSSSEPGPGRVRVNDQKLQATPAIADLDGDKKLEVIIRSQVTDISEEPADPQIAARGFLHAFRADGSPVPGWPVELPGVAEVYGSAQEFITEGSNSPVAADVDGDGNDEVVSNAVLSPSVMFDGDGSRRTVFAPLPDATLGALAGRLDPTDVLNGELPVDVPVGFTTTGAFGRFAGGLSFAQPGSGAATIGAALALPGTGIAINNYERAFDASTGLPRPGFPAKFQGLDFLGAPLVVDVTGDGEAELVDAGDSNVLHGFGATGGQVDGFPKFTTGWAIWSPSAGDLDGDGTTELVLLTREGYLFAWRTKGTAAGNGEWWRWHHDEWSTGRYGTDARPPGVIRDARVEAPPEPAPDPDTPDSPETPTDVAEERAEEAREAIVRAHAARQDDESGSSGRDGEDEPASGRGDDDEPRPSGRAAQDEDDDGGDGAGDEGDGGDEGDDEADVRQGPPPPTNYSFVAPGDDWYAGKATRYRVVADGGEPATVEATAAAGERQTLSAPADTRSVVVQAVDDAGNLGTPKTIVLRADEPRVAEAMPGGGGGGDVDEGGDGGGGDEKKEPSGGGLPFTGFTVGFVALLGLVLLVAGRRLRRAAG
jgi:hypothetical protein